MQIAVWLIIATNKAEWFNAEKAYGLIVQDSGEDGSLTSQPSM
jgi:hypothetical protein